MMDITQNKIPLLVIGGPTASGKTAVGVCAAKLLNGEIISADSMQVYKDSPIATAKPTDEETGGVPHHLMSVLDCNRQFSVAEYAHMAHNIIADINNRGRLPIMVGGTGLYIKAVVENLQFCEQDTAEYHRLREQYKAIEAERLFDMLRECDPEQAEILGHQNKGRVIRALAVYQMTGRTAEENLAWSRSVPTPYSTLYTILSYNDRQTLYDRINRRVDIMAAQGLEEEARMALVSPAGTFSQAIGHKELAPYFRGECSLEQTLDALKMQTRRYAKRQTTWFSAVPNAVRIECDGKQAPAIAEEIAAMARSENSPINNLLP